MSRKHGGRNQSKTMLIFTEGYSEITYFKRFKGRNQPVAVVPIFAKRHDSKNLVSHCASKAKERGIDFEIGDTISIVVDVDERTELEIKEIEQQCEEYGMNLYLSNRSFECWLCFHFVDLTKPLSQKELEDILAEKMGCKYYKTEGINKHINDSNVDAAIRRATLKISNEKEKNTECLKINPSTSVHFLVKNIKDKYTS